MHKAIDYTGKKFRHLTMLQLIRGRGAGRHAVWLARCDCGEIKEVVGKEAARGHVGSCGKCEYSRRLRAGRTEHLGGSRLSLPTAHRLLYTKFLRECNRRNIMCSLSIEEFVDIIGKRCTYCNREPSTILPKSKLRYSYVYLVEPSGPYTLANSLAVCTHCRRMQGPLNSQEYLRHLLESADFVRSILTK